jgi:hypothetical protein
MQVWLAAAATRFARKGGLTKPSGSSSGTGPPRAPKSLSPWTGERAVSMARADVAKANGDFDGAFDAVDRFSHGPQALLGH